MTSKELEALGKFKMYASLEVAEIGEELAKVLELPPPERRQKDLQYLSAVLVSSGFNLNSTYFLPSELIMASDTIVNKPIDIEHEMEDIVGHMYAQAYVDKNGFPFDPLERFKVEKFEVDKTEMDIIIAAVLYKTRFPELSQKVAKGESNKVSMECYYKNFDIIVDNIIIPRDEAEALGLVSVINNTIKVKEGSLDLGTHRVGKVLRGILFSGCGIVKTPANPDSVVLEVATEMPEVIPVKKSDYILDLTRVDSYMTAKKEEEAIVLHKLEGTDKEVAYMGASYGGIHSHELDVGSDSTFLDGNHIHLVMPNDVPEGSRVYFIRDGDHRHPFNNGSGKVGGEKGHIHKFYVEKEDKNGAYSVKVYETGPAVSAHTHEIEGIDVRPVEDPVTYEIKGVKRGNLGSTTWAGSHYHEVIVGDEMKMKTITPKDILKLEEASKEGAEVSTADEEVSQEEKSSKSVLDSALDEPMEVKDPPLSKPEICVSFRRYVYEKGGDNPGTPANVEPTPGMVDQVESLPIPAMPGGGGEATQVDTILHENWCTLFDLDCPVGGGMAAHPDCLRHVIGRLTKEEVHSYFDKLKQNQKISNVKSNLASLLDVIKFTDEN